MKGCYRIPGDSNSRVVQPIHWLVGQLRAHGAAWAMVSPHRIDAVIEQIEATEMMLPAGK
ncbi:MAG TPA: hypothetical protein PKD64_00295 [Pirellulaceae bacterium]|nr:hypothetical protein [Pirellulaceae bacterium]HMO90610.1 hypothetical protein [Pirellulaceae bacterium]HMP67811.1 hypothetical protein [Pirellulaceae bacterium]